MSENKELNQVTSVYPVIPASVVPVPTKKVADLANGGMRNRKYAAYVSAAIIRDLVDHQDPVIIQGDLPKILIDGDTLQEVKERMFEELSAVFQNAQDLVDGKITMEDLDRQATEQAKIYEDAVRAEFAKKDGTETN